MLIDRLVTCCSAKEVDYTAISCLCKTHLTEPDFTPDGKMIITRFGITEFAQSELSAVFHSSCNIRDVIRLSMPLSVDVHLSVRRGGHPARLKTLDPGQNHAGMTLWTE